MTIENNTNTTFETKEQYLQMIEAWKETFQSSRKLDRNEYGNKIPKLIDTDFFIYAILRGKNPRKCYHTEARFQEALSEMEWVMANDSRLNRHLSDLFGDTCNADNFRSAWNFFQQNEEAA